jgi:hypothetical protein
MARQKQSRGRCVYCQRDFAKGGLSRHLPSCSERAALLERLAEEGGRKQKMYHLQAYDAYMSDYWLHLEMPASATLGDLDSYLRAIWLECCGHLSAFMQEEWRTDQFPMSLRLGRLFEPGLELTHIYDFGTQSETKVKVVSEREGVPTTGYPVALMGRNEPPEAPCQECERSARWICLECAYDLEEPGLLCDKHEETHPHDDYGPPLPLVNSPRAGMCGYDGPAEPPY